MSEVIEVADLFELELELPNDKHWSLFKEIGRL